MRPNRCPLFEFFFNSGRRVNERCTNIIVSNTRTDNWKIRFNASIASCVSIKNTHAPLLVLKFEYGIHETFRVIAFSMEERHCILTEKFTFSHFLNKLPVIGKLPLQDHCFTPL